MRDLFAIKMFEDRLGLNARHDARARHRKWQRGTRDLIAFEETLEIVFHDVTRVARITHHHAIKILEAKMSAIKYHMKWAGDRCVARGILTTQHLEHMSRKRFGFNW